VSSDISERKAVSTIEQRARWEATESRLGAPGTVRVDTVSYGAESGEHVYLVIVEDGETVEWTCPADEYQQKCKHRIAVEANTAVLEAGNASVERMREARR
jgi:hypothetical protein